jgi:hypothetical protein
MDLDKMSNLYREPSIDASYEVSVHFEYRYLYLNKSYLSFNREDILEINQSETRMACGGHVC